MFELKIMIYLHQKLLLFSTKFKLILHIFPGKILQLYRWLEDDRSRMSV